MKNRLVAIRKVVNRSRWGHIRRAVNPADITTRVSIVTDFDRWFLGPVILFQIKFKFEGFDATKMSELVEDVLNIESNGTNSGKNKRRSILTNCVVTHRL